MWIDTVVLAPSQWLAQKNPVRWSRYKDLQDTINDLEQRHEDKRILCKVRLPNGHTDEFECSNPKDAVEKLQGSLTILQQASRSAQRVAARRQHPTHGIIRQRHSPDGIGDKSKQMNRELDVQQLKALAGDMGGASQQRYREARHFRTMRGGG